MAKDEMVQDPEYGYRSKSWLEKKRRHKRNQKQQEASVGFNVEPKKGTLWDKLDHGGAKKSCWNCGDEFIPTHSGQGRCADCLARADSMRSSRKFSPYYDEGIYEDVDLAGGYRGAYDYGFDTPMYNGYVPEPIRRIVGDAEANKIGKQAELDYFHKQWDSYESGGEWRGYSYFRKPTIDYKYIDQMANAFSAQHNIKVEIGEDWSVDLKNKVLTFNPTSLMYGTKGEVIATLLHEIGTIRHVTPTDELKSEYLKKYERPASEVLDCFEDLRVDAVMSDSYPSAKELMEGNKKVYAELVKRMTEKADKIREGLKRHFETSVNGMMQEIGNGDEVRHVASRYGVDESLLKEFSDQESNDILKSILSVRQKSKSMDTVYDYMSHLLDTAYNLKLDTAKKASKEVKEAVTKTEKAFKSSDKFSSSAETLSMMDKDVYPVIEEFLKNYWEPEVKKDIEKMFGKDFAERMMQGAYRNAGEGGDPRQVQSGGQRGSSFGSRAGKGNTIPQPWADGDYAALKESVDGAIKQLIRKLKNLRAVEQTPKWVGNQRRGRLNVKDLYKFAAGGRRLFKNKQELKDTIKSFAFSFMFDRSGSMSGAKVIHSMRGMIILMEVFSSLGIPFEVIAFGDNPKVLKKFDGDFDLHTKNQIAGMVTQCNTGTQLANSLRALEIGKRPEKNKTLIVLSDGDLYDVGESQRELQKLGEKGVGAIAYALLCGVEYVANVFGRERSRSINDPNKLPGIFDEMFRELLKKKGGIKI